MEHSKTVMTFLTSVLWVNLQDRTPKEEREVLSHKDMVDEISTNETGGHMRRGHNIFICQLRTNLVLKFLKIRCGKIIRQKQ